MSNNEFIAVVHLAKHQELLDATNNQSHLLNADMIPVQQQMHQAMVRASESAHTTVCRVGALKHTALCPVPSN